MEREKVSLDFSLKSGKKTTSAVISQRRMCGRQLVPVNVSTVRDVADAIINLFKILF